MATNWDVDSFVQQDLDLFGIDEVHEVAQYADAPNAGGAYQQFSLGNSNEFSSLASPQLFDFTLFQSPSPPQTNHGYQGFAHSWGSPADFRQNFAQTRYESFDTLLNSPMVEHSTWSSPAISRALPYHTNSQPVPIPVHSQQQNHGHLSPSSSNYPSLFSEPISSWPSSATSMSRTESVAESVTSEGTTIEEPLDFGKRRVRTKSESVESSPALSMVQHIPTGRSGQLRTVVSGKKARGRHGPLSDGQRIATARMRITKACQACRKKKTRCDPGIPCRSCISYYKSDLVNHPCRGQRLADLADRFLQGHIFPARHQLPPSFQLHPTYEFEVYITIGFGWALPCRARLLIPIDSNPKFHTELVHNHVLYKWHGQHRIKTQKYQEKELVFPAMLTEDAALKSNVDTHLEKLIADPSLFRSFPVYNSPLKVLKSIYQFYYNLGKSGEERQAKQLICQALKLLNLIHIGGDIGISMNEEARNIMNLYFSPQFTEQSVSPCFIRGQLGEVFAELALDYMKEILNKLEQACLDRTCSMFPVVVCTYAVLLMAIESIQYKTHKDTFHSLQYTTAVPTDGTSIGDEIDGIMDLIAFYKNCFESCHRERLLSIVDLEPYYLQTRNIPAAFKAGEQAIAQLRDAIKTARPYLGERSRESLLTTGGDITVFFDRLVARLLLLES